MTWVMRRALVLRQTCRHAREAVSPHPSIAHTKDGRWVMANLGTRPGDDGALVALLERYGMDAGLDAGEAGAADRADAFVPGHRAERRPSATTAWRPCSASCARSPTRTCRGARRRKPGMLWAPLRKPHENAIDPHWLERRSCTDVEHPELGRSFRYATSKWMATANVLVGRPPRAAAERGRRRPSMLPREARPAGDRRRRAASTRRGPLVAARQAVPAARHPHPRLLVVPGVRRRHALPERVRRREHQGRVEEPPGHAAGRDGAGRRPRRARRRRPGRCPA